MIAVTKGIKEKIIQKCKNLKLPTEFLRKNSFLLMGVVVIFALIVLTDALLDTGSLETIKEWGLTHQSDGRNNHYETYLFNDYAAEGLAYGQKIEQDILITPKMLEDEKLHLNILFGTSGKEIQGKIKVVLNQGWIGNWVECASNEIQESVYYEVVFDTADLEPGMATIEISSLQYENEDVLAVYYAKPMPKGDYRLGLNAIYRVPAYELHKPIRINGEEQEGVLAMEVFTTKD